MRRTIQLERVGHSGRSVIMDAGGRRAHPTPIMLPLLRNSRLLSAVAALALAAVTLAGICPCPERAPTADDGSEHGCCPSATGWSAALHADCCGSVHGAPDAAAAPAAPLLIAPTPLIVAPASVRAVLPIALSLASPNTSPPLVLRI